MFLSSFCWSYSILHAIGTEQGPTQFSQKYITDYGGGGLWPPLDMIVPHAVECWFMTDGLIGWIWDDMNIFGHLRSQGGPLGGLKAPKKQKYGSFNFKNLIL